MWLRFWLEQTNLIILVIHCSRSFIKWPLLNFSKKCPIGILIDKTYSFALCRRLSKALTFTWDKIHSYLRKVFFLSAPGRPANLTVSSVHDLTITLRWTRPKTTAGLTDNSTLSYTVSYKADQDSSFKRSIVPTESAQLDLAFKKRYNIFVQAMHRQDHQIKGAWSRKLVVNTNNLGKFSRAKLERRSYEVRYPPPTMLENSVIPLHLCFQQTNKEQQQKRK